MSSKSPRKFAHPNTYLIGNMLLVLVLWIVTTAVLWQLLPLWWLVRVVLSLIALIVLAYLEHDYCTGLVGRIVERLFPDEETTERYHRNAELMERVRRRGHW